MRLLPPLALLGSFLSVATLDAQILTEHAAAAAGATIGTAAGKPLSNALGSIFGQVNKQTANAAGAKVVKKPESKATPTAQPKNTAAATVTQRTGSSAAPAEESPAPVARPTRVAARRRLSVPTEPVVTAPITIEPAVKEISAADVATVKIGASGTELQAALGAPESHVIIPGDDGRLLEICQYWANGQPLGTIRLIDGQVASIETAR